jgi:hypothetical protein
MEMEVWIVKMPSGPIGVFSTLRGAMKAAQDLSVAMGFSDAACSRDAFDVWTVEVGSREIFIYPERVRE